MTNGLSLYLDLIRFLMSFEVMLGHSTFHGYTGHGFLWQVDPFRHMQTAVIGFFVLSGFVIAYVSDNKEKNLLVYASSRIARMHSIIIPALLVTLLFDWLGQTVNAEFYKTNDFPTPIAGNQVASYLLSFFYLNNVWFIPQVTPGTNGPFWTMTYEVMFYAIFGAAFYMRGILRYVIVALLTLAAGKKILVLFPIWLMGYMTYRVSKKYSMPTKGAVALFGITVIGIIASSISRQGAIWSFTDRATHLDYAAGFFISLNIYAAASLSGHLEKLLGKVSVSVRWLGMLTFSLYLCHRPLLNFFSVFSVSNPESLIQKLWLFSGTFFVVIVVAYSGEFLRSKIRNLFAKVIDSKIKFFSPVA